MSTNEYFILPIRSAMLGEGHIRIFGTLQIGHTIHEGHQRLQSSVHTSPSAMKSSWNPSERINVY
jgi:hypothetical protein